MDSATFPYGAGFEMTCNNCGARLEVPVTMQDGHNEREDYNCPECDKRYYTRASLPIINVQVVTPRTDGKTDKYQNPPEDEE